MSEVSRALEGWLQEILGSIHTQDRKQRAVRKYSIADLEAKVRQNCSVTHTGKQIRYINRNAKKYLEGILKKGRDGDLSQACLIDPVSKERKLNLIIDRYISENKRDTSEAKVVRRDLNRELAKTQPFSEEFQKRLRDYIARGLLSSTAGPLTEAHIDYLREAYIPREIWRALRPLDGQAHIDRIYRLAALIRDAELKGVLEQELEPGSEALIQQFLTDRLAAFGGRLGAEIERELKEIAPDLNMTKQSSMNKCLLSLYYNLKQAMILQKRSTKDFSIVKSLDRRKEVKGWSQMVRPERASLALRRAVLDFSQGIGMMTTGLREKQSSERASLELRGYRRITATLDTNTGGPCSEILGPSSEEKDKTKTCTQLSPNMTCAASALLVAFFEFMDTCVSPSPPLIMRSHFRVEEFYVNPDLKLETYDVAKYQEWSRDKKAHYRQAHRRFQQYYETMGFQVIGKDDITGLPTLNFSDWGSPDLNVVANPARVREETYLYRYLGQWRPSHNRLQMDRESWTTYSKHVISPRYDPDYAKKYLKIMNPKPKPKQIPRPIVILHGYDREEDRGLYKPCNSQTVKQYTFLRESLNQLSMEKYIKFMNDKYWTYQVSTMEVPSLPTLHMLPASGLACQDLHQHWQLPLLRDRLSLGLLDGSEDSKQWMVALSEDRGYGISVRDVPSAWYQVQDRWSPADRSLLQEFKDLPPRQRFKATFPPPPLFSRLVHPLTGRAVSLDYFKALIPGAGVVDLMRTPKSLLERMQGVEGAPVWFNRDVKQNDITFAYPLQTLSGVLDPDHPVLPLVELQPSGVMIQYAPELSVVHPGPGWWDIRNSLAFLLNRSGRAKLERLIKTLNNSINGKVRTRQQILEPGKSKEPAKSKEPMVQV